jgi:hypothetical protein
MNATAVGGVAICVVSRIYMCNVVAQRAQRRHVTRAGAAFAPVFLREYGRSGCRVQAETNTFVRLAQKMCDATSQQHCVAASFIGLPLAAIFLAMLPFTIRLWDTDKAGDADAANVFEDVKTPWRVRMRNLQSPRGRGDFHALAGDENDAEQSPSGPGYWPQRWMGAVLLLCSAGRAVSAIVQTVRGCHSCSARGVCCSPFSRVRCGDVFHDPDRAGSEGGQRACEARHVPVGHRNRRRVARQRSRRCEACQGRSRRPGLRAAVVARVPHRQSRDAHHLRRIVSDRQ